MYRIAPSAIRPMASTTATQGVSLYDLKKTDMPDPRQMFCFIGHQKEYVAIRDTTRKERCRSSSCCSLFWHLIPVKEARWVCKRCGAMREHYLPDGCWKIEFGQLLPDHKAYANWEDKPQAGGIA